MINMKEVLKKLEEKDIHIHEIDTNHKYPFFYVPSVDTHFAMQGSEIIMVGTTSSMIRLAYD